MAFATLRAFAERVARSALRLVPPGTWMPIVFGPARGFRWRVGTAPQSFWLGLHEGDLVRRLWAALPAQGIAFDLGGHAGYYTLMLVRRFSHVHTFEPFPADLNAHIARNHLESRVTVHPIAVSDFNGTAKMLGSGACRRIDQDGTVTVPVAKLDDLELPDPTFIKIDIEGQEAAALRGMERLLRRARPTLFIALHSAHARDEAAALLDRCNYTIEILPGDEWLARPRTENVRR